MFFLFLFFSHLLITLCTQPTQIKEQLQSRSRKLELKGVLSLALSLSFAFYLSLSPSFLDTSLQTAQASRVLSEAMSAWAGPYPLHLFLFLYLAEMVLSRVPGPGIAETPTGLRSNERTVPEWRTNKIRNTKAEGYLRPRRKEAPFTHYWFLSCSQHTQLQYTVQTFNTTYFQVLDVNSKQTYISEEDEITYPEDGIYSLLSPSQKVGGIHRPWTLVTVWFKSGDAAAPHNMKRTLSYVSLAQRPLFSCLCFVPLMSL